MVWQDSAAALDLDDVETWFDLEVVERIAPPFRGAMVNLTANEAIADQTSTVISCDAVEFDTDGFWSSANPTRLTLPAGVSRVRLIGNLRWENDGSGNRRAWLRKKGTGFPGAPMVMHGAGGVVGQNLATSALPVSAGDFVELAAWHSAGATIDVEAHNQTWLGGGVGIAVACGQRLD